MAQKNAARRAANSARKAAKIKAKRIKLESGIVHVEVPVGAKPVVLVDPEQPHVVRVAALPPKVEVAGFWASLFGTGKA